MSPGEITPVGEVGKRIEELRRSLPPKPDRNSRIGYISIEDFAELLGTGKQNLLNWIKGRSRPDPVNRARLASVSNGRFTADDFLSAEERRGEAAAGAASSDPRPESIEAALFALTKEVRAGFAKLDRRLKALETRQAIAEPPARPRKRRAG